MWSAGSVSRHRNSVKFAKQKRHHRSRIDFQQDLFLVDIFLELSKTEYGKQQFKSCKRCPFFHPVQQFRESIALCHCPSVLGGGTFAAVIITSAVEIMFM